MRAPSHRIDTCSIAVHTGAAWQRLQHEIGGHESSNRASPVCLYCHCTMAPTALIAPPESALPSPRHPHICAREWGVVRVRSKQEGMECKPCGQESAAGHGTAQNSTAQHSTLCYCQSTNVSLPPMKPPACTKTQPGIPDSSLSCTGRAV